MARPVLPTDFKDDILAESMSGKRRYRIIQNTDGTVSLDDVTDYEQVGSTFGAKQVNDMSSAVNSIEDVKAANNCTTTEPGFVLDARQGKTLMDKSNELSRDLNAINDNGAIKGMDAREDGVYITYSTGADTVTKKLGDIITREVTGHCGNFHPNYPERSILIDIPAISGYEYFDCAIKECYFENSNGAQKSIRFKIEKYGASKIRVFPGKDSVWTSGGVSATATVMIFYK